MFLLVVFWNLQKLFTTLRQRSPTTSFPGYQVPEFLTKPTFIYGPTSAWLGNFSRLVTSPLACLARYFSRRSRKRKEEPLLTACLARYFSRHSRKREETSDGRVAVSKGDCQPRKLWAIRYRKQHFVSVLKKRGKERNL